MARDVAHNPDVVRTGTWARLSPYIEVGKLKIVEMWLGVPVAWSLLGSDHRTDPRAALITAMAVPVIAGTAAVSLTLDDIMGVRDGVDLANHGDKARYRVNKPLLDGRLSERQALNFVYLVFGIALASALIMLALSWPFPGWLAVLTFAILLIPLNYSFGLKMSYHGLGELLTMSAIAGSVLLPYSAVIHSLPAPVILQAALLGLWMVHISAFSNTKDREGDRSVRRMTIAAILSRRGNYVFIVSLFVVTWALTLYGLTTGLLSRPLGYALVPLWALQIWQLWIGVFQENWLKARIVGFLLYRYALLALFLTNLTR